MTDVTSPQAPSGQGQQKPDGGATGIGRGGGAGASTARGGGAGASKARGGEAGASTARGGGAGASTARGGEAGASTARGGGAGGKTGRARPLPPGDSLYTPGASDARRRVERSSARPLVWLHQQPAWFPPLVVTLLLVVGLAVPGWLGAAALVLVAAFLGWLAGLSWPRLTGGGRLLRLAAIAGVLVVAVIQVTR